MSTRKPQLFELLPVDLPQLQLITVTPQKATGAPPQRAANADLAELQPAVRRPAKYRLH
jgi:hypothetical protein